MNLPFSPTFFRKIDLFQQLMEFESQKVQKHLWDGEKAVLIWSGSDKHQLLGTPIDHNHVKDALQYCEDTEYISAGDKQRLLGNVTDILESLAVHGFGERTDVIGRHNVQLRININGILAGQILAETNNLKINYKYRIWTYDWLLLYYSAGLLLVIQVIKGMIELFDKISKLNP